MGQHLWMSTNHIVIHSYSPVADFLLVVMCLLSHCILLVFGIADLLAPLYGWGFEQDHCGTCVCA